MPGYSLYYRFVTTQFGEDGLFGSNVEWHIPVEHRERIFDPRGLLALVHLDHPTNAILLSRLLEYPGTSDQLRALLDTGVPSSLPIPKPDWLPFDIAVQRHGCESDLRCKSVAEAMAEVGDKTSIPVLARRLAAQTHPEIRLCYQVAMVALGDETHLEDVLDKFRLRAGKMPFETLDDTLPFLTALIPFDIPFADLGVTREDESFSETFGERQDPWRWRLLDNDEARLKVHGVAMVGGILRSGNREALETVLRTIGLQISPPSEDGFPSLLSNSEIKRNIEGFPVGWKEVSEHWVPSMSSEKIREIYQPWWVANKDRLRFPEARRRWEIAAEPADGEER